MAQYPGYGYALVKYPSAGAGADTGTALFVYLPGTSVSSVRLPYPPVPGTSICNLCNISIPVQAEFYSPAKVHAVFSRQSATFDENRRAVGMLNPMRDQN